jgi:hypothetical protein
MIAHECSACFPRLLMLARLSPQAQLVNSVYFFFFSPF